MDGVGDEMAEWTVGGGSGDGKEGEGMGVSCGGAGVTDGSAIEGGEEIGEGDRSAGRTKLGGGGEGGLFKGDFGG